jgi:hypothetical protein
MARKAFTMESNVDKIIEKIQEKPYTVMTKIGMSLSKEIQGTLPRKSGLLRESLSYWARKKEKDLQIGFYLDKKLRSGRAAAFYSNVIFGKQNDPIKPVVVKNAELIKQLIGAALDEIRSE